MTIRGALVKKSADQIGANYKTSSAQVQTDGVVVTWDSEVYDSSGFHSTSINTSRLTIPATVNGSYGIITACLSIASMAENTLCIAKILKNGTYQYIGFGGTQHMSGDISASASQSWVQVRTSPVLLSTNDYFEVALFANDTSIDVKAESSFGILVLDDRSQTQRVLTRKSANQTAANYSTRTAITWNQDVYDTDSIHDVSSNTTKLIVPSALNGKYGIVQASVGCTSVTNSISAALGIAKGGSLTYNGFGGNSVLTAATAIGLTCRTQPILLTTGDEFEAVFYTADTSIDVLATRCSFGLRVVGQFAAETTGQADGVATAQAATFAYSTGTANGLAIVQGFSVETVKAAGQADGLANVAGSGGVPSVGNADGHANVFSVPGGLRTGSAWMIA
jgi:hypothetical protein